MREQTKTKVRSLIAAVVVLAILAGVLAIGYIGNTVAMSSYATQLENNYQRSVYELITDVNNIETDLSKALISSNILTYFSQENTPIHLGAESVPSLIHGFNS